MARMERSLLKSYLLRQLQTARDQLSLIGPEAEMEALHRFRVALRRFRSVLAAYTHDLYAPDAIVKSMVKLTNRLRETDVFLASIEPSEYPKLHQALTRFREKQYKKLWKPETTERFEQTLDSLIADFDALKLDPGEKKLIRTGEKLFERAKKAHKALTKDTEEEKIHETRLLYKQVRYVLEFLNESGLIDAEKKIKKVKTALDHFGAIQDAVNQLDWLRRFCSKHSSDECHALYEARKKALHLLKKAFKV